jgi:hypothetical protein
VAVTVSFGIYWFVPLFSFVGGTSAFEECAIYIFRVEVSQNGVV